MLLEGWVVDEKLARYFSFNSHIKLSFLGFILKYVTLLEEWVADEILEHYFSFNNHFWPSESDQNFKLLFKFFSFSQFLDHVSAAIYFLFVIYWLFYSTQLSLIQYRQLSYTWHTNTLSHDWKWAQITLHEVHLFVWGSRELVLNYHSCNYNSANCLYSCSTCHCSWWNC